MGAFILDYITDIFNIIAVVCGLLAWRRSGRGSRIICVHLIFTALSEQVAIYLAHTYHNNHWWYNLYFPADLTILLTAGYYLRPTAGTKRLSILLLLTALVFQAGQYLVIGGKSMMQWTMVVNAITICILFLKQMLEFLRRDEINKSLLIVCFGLVFYYGSSIPYNIAYMYFVRNGYPEYSNKSLLLNHFLIVIMFCIISFGYLTSLFHYRKTAVNGQQ